MEHHGPAYKPPTTTWWWWLLCCYALNKQPKKIYIYQRKEHFQQMVLVKLDGYTGNDFLNRTQVT